MIAFPCPVQALTNWLATALNQLRGSDREFTTLTLQRIRTAQTLLYGSPVGLQFASQFALEPSRLLEELQAILLSILANQNLDADLWNIQVYGNDSGWIYFQFTDASIAAWLEQMRAIPPQFLFQPQESGAIDSKPIPLNPAAVFALQYAHARCCSLLRLAHRQKLVQLANPDPVTAPVHWEILAPNPIPWINANGQLLCNHPAEWELLAQLWEFPGGLASAQNRWQPNWEFNPERLVTFLAPHPELRNLRQQVTRWSDRFDSFYRHCRIWGEVQAENRQRAVVRLGLLAMMQSILHLYLQLLKTPAPLEL